MYILCLWYLQCASDWQIWQVEPSVGGSGYLPEVGMTQYKFVNGVFGPPIYVMVTDGRIFETLTIQWIIQNFWINNMRFLSRFSSHVWLPERQNRWQVWFVNAKTRSFFKGTIIFKKQLGFLQYPILWQTHVTTKVPLLPEVQRWGGQVKMLGW